MTVQLSGPVAAYFAADKSDSEAVAQCFTDNAIVTDEGHTYTGRNEIRRWRVETSNKYVYTSEPFASEKKDGNVIVTSRLTGNFPGSPVDLRFFFRIEGDRIASLQIHP